MLDTSLKIAFQNSVDLRLCLSTPETVKSRWVSNLDNQRNNTDHRIPSVSLESGARFVILLILIHVLMK
jgi:hypothetical protein